MASSRSWMAYRPTYRAREVGILANCIRVGESGSVVGLAGAGKSNLLGFLCHWPEVMRSYWSDSALKPALVQVDLNNLPGNDLVTFYQLILRALYEARAQLAAIEPSLVTAIEALYRKIEDKMDPFLSQSAPREVLLLFQDSLLVASLFLPLCAYARRQLRAPAC